MKIISGLLLILTSLLIGCSVDSTVDSADYLIRSENRMLTAAGADKLLSVQLIVAKGGHARAKQYIDSIDKKFKLDTVLQQYAEQKNIRVDAKIVDKTKKNILAQHHDFDVNLIRTLERLIKDELLVKAVRKEFSASCNVKIPASEVTRRAQLISKINQSGSLSNACQYARATNCWNQIRQGQLTFEDACKKYDETKNPSPVGEWAELTLDAFDEEESQLRNLLINLKVGEVTPPVIGENGLVIVKLLGTGMSPENVGMGVPAKTYRLARIFFHLYDIFPTQTADELREDLTQIELNRRWSMFVEHLLSQEKFTYGQRGQTLENWKNQKLKEAKK